MATPGAVVEAAVALLNEAPRCAGRGAVAGVAGRLRDGHGG